MSNKPQFISVFTEKDRDKMIELGYTLFTTEKCADKCRYLFIDNGEQVFSDSVDKFVYTNQLNF